MYFSVGLAQAGAVKIQLYNCAGEQVAFVQGEAGINRVDWDCSSVAPGIYIARVSAGDRVKTLKVAVVK